MLWYQGQINTTKAPRIVNKLQCSSCAPINIAQVLLLEPRFYLQPSRENAAFTHHLIVLMFWRMPRAFYYALKAASSAHSEIILMNGGYDNKQHSGKLRSLISLQCITSRARRNSFVPYFKNTYKQMHSHLYDRTNHPLKTCMTYAHIKTRPG